jgi:WD40 repeat protein
VLATKCSPVSGERGLFLWPIRLATEADEMRIGPAKAVSLPGAWEQATLSEDGRVFAAFHDDHAFLFDAGAMRETSRTAVCGDKNQLRYLSLSSDALRLATGGWHDEGVKIWDAHTGALIKELKEPDWKALASPSPMFEPNGGSLVVACWANYSVWETNSWTAGPRLPRNGFTNMAISHRGRLLASAQHPTAIQLRDLDTGEVLATLQSPVTEYPTAIAFSPDDTQLAVVNRGTRDLLVWDLRLLREDLKKMGMDWLRPPYPPAAAISLPPARVRVLTNSGPAIVGHG